MYGVVKVIDFVAQNDIESYIEALFAGVGVAPNQSIDLRNFRTLIAITTGIIQHDNGIVPYSNTGISDGVQRALASL